ncbi:SIR2 family protein [Algibacter pectinivorans]|uniref:NAD(+) hydrolase ThsA n=1 Tax=Algibacter pectinivorans TaxID=870482 RepID=A0A1I1QQD9_9FLAO|nr:SIR2 family protein [Algibacter pectinivorans]SFD24269.1 SIR2-like domain-containing protein [Algibacter pectinivorans]
MHKNNAKNTSGKDKVKKQFSPEIEVFINDYVKKLNEGVASIFAGAGLSIPAGYVNWPELMSEIAQDLGLDINQEKDLVSIAQYHVNENQNRSKLNQKILDEFTEDTDETENHRVISRLPVSSIWTTNYDKLIEKSYLKENKVVDVKYMNNQLLTTKPKRDLVVYKMHGDVNHPDEAILTKEQYEQYYQTHEPFLNALSGELITKTFLFIGFSFTDPNLDYVLSRLNFRFSKNKRTHYCFVKRHELGDSLNSDQAALDYNNRRQSLTINDLKRYGIKTLLVDSYSDITGILEEIEARYKKRTIFISGSAETYEPHNKHDAIGFVHNLSKAVIENNYKIVNGFGWGIGSSVINGALETIQSKPNKYSESQLILKPFPQFETGSKNLKELWSDYRQKMISQCGISIFVFGNKLVDEEIVEASGMMDEFEIAHQNGCMCIPIGLTGSASKSIYDVISKAPKEYYDNPDVVMPILKELADEKTTFARAVKILKELLKTLKK